MKSLNLPYNPRIDQLRWLAATIVFLFHFYLEYRGAGGATLPTAWLGIFTEGHTGVGLFFTLSGFLFMQIAEHQQRIEYGAFLRNRMLRIFPLFLTVFLVAISIGRDKFQPQDLLYVFATNLGLAPTSATTVTGPAWSISLEFSFYLLFPFLARFAMEQGPRYLLKILALLVFFKLVAYTVNDNSELMYFSTFIGRFDQFIVGMLAAMCFRRHAPLLQRHARWLLPVMAVGVFGNSAMQAHYAAFEAVPKSPFWIVWSLIESTGWACFIMAWLAAGLRLPAWLERVLNQGGKISFSFYLLHMAMIHLLAHAFGLLKVSGNVWLDALLMLVVVYGACWAIATLSYGTIEEPFLRMRRHYGQAAAAPDTSR
jgi:peptidoglycan/LPS O-acetylase OafA/YrhL